MVEQLLDEVLVYDLERHKAHCLNRCAALVWRHCDGETTVAQMVELLAEQAEVIDEDVVWNALDQLEKARLLRERMMKSAGRARVSRRDLVRKVGLAAAVPLVTSILAPTAYAQASCAGPEESCLVLPCCAGLICVVGQCIFP